MTQVDISLHAVGQIEGDLRVHIMIVHTLVVVRSAPESQSSDKLPMGAPSRNSERDGAWRDSASNLVLGDCGLGYQRQFAHSALHHKARDNEKGGKAEEMVAHN